MCSFTYKSTSKQSRETPQKKESKYDIPYFVKEISSIITIVVKRGESIRFSKIHWANIILSQSQMDSIVNSLQKNFPDSIINFEIISDTKGSRQQFLIVDLY